MHSKQKWYCSFHKKDRFWWLTEHLNKKDTSNETKHALVKNSPNERSEKVKLLSTKDYSFLLGRINACYKQWWISKYVCLSSNI